MKTDLIPRSVLFGNPDKAGVQVSPDGRYISYLAPRNGVLNVYVAEIADLSSAKPVTNDTKRGIRMYAWLHTGEHLIYMQDNKGDENWHVHTVNLKTHEDVDIMPFDGVRSGGVSISYKNKTEFLVQMNKRNKSYFDVYKYNLDTKALEVIYENDGEFSGFVINDEYKIVFAKKSRTDGGFDVYIFDQSFAYSSFMTIPTEDVNTTYFCGFNKQNDTVYMISSVDRNTSALLSINIETQEQEVIYTTDKADITEVMLSPVKKVLQRIGYEHLKPEHVVMDQSVQEDFAYLESLDDGVIDVTSTDLENKTWIVVYLSDTKPVKYYLYNRDTRQARFLFTNRSDLAKCELAPMHPVLIKSRDGLDMVSYLTLPNDAVAHKSSTRPIKPLPLILNVHGGPTARDSWGLNAEHQWFSNRGYAVLSVNYRSSIGFGKEFINKGRGEWGGCMHDDLIDAVNWAVDNKIAARDKVAIYGGSYGGYAALVGLTFTPDVFACAVDIVGPSNLITLLKSIPPYWQPYYVELIRRTGGDPDTEEGRKFLESRSPLTFADRIKKPLLIAQGANDPRVKQAEADQIVAAMEANGIPFTYALYPDEGHGFARPENRISFYAVVEEFLQKHLGGKAEPIGNAFEGASVQIKEN